MPAGRMDACGTIVPHVDDRPAGVHPSRRWTIVPQADDRPAGVRIVPQASIRPAGAHPSNLVMYSARANAHDDAHEERPPCELLAYDGAHLDVAAVGSPPEA